MHLCVFRPETTQIERESRSPQPKKYLYCMVGNTRSPAARRFHRNMEKNIRKKRKSMIAYKGFWDWDSEPGREMEDMFDEKIHDSHFVVGVFENMEERQSVSRLLSAFKYHIDNGSGEDGNTQAYIPVLLCDVTMPLNFNIIETLDFYKESMR